MTLSVSVSNDFKEKTLAHFNNGRYARSPYLHLQKNGGFFAGMEVIYFDKYKPTITLLDDIEKQTSLAQVAHGTGTALLAGVAGAGSLALGAGILALGLANQPKKDEYRFLHIALNDGRQAILRASKSAFQKIEPFINA